MTASVKINSKLFSSDRRTPLISDRSDIALFKRLARRYPTPEKVQRFLREEFPYNFEKKGETLRSAAGALKAGMAHCLEASLVAAAVLEYQGFPPLVMSMESLDDLDHVVFIFKARTGWGSVGRSREPGLHGREPVFRSVRDLMWSYLDPFVDNTGALTGYGTTSLDQSGANWRFSKTNVWKVEQFLIDLPHRNIRTSKTHFRSLRKRYLAKGPIISGPHWW